MDYDTGKMFETILAQQKELEGKINYLIQELVKKKKPIQQTTQGISEEIVEE